MKGLQHKKGKRNPATSGEAAEKRREVETAINHDLANMQDPIEGVGVTAIASSSAPVAYIPPPTSARKQVVVCRRIGLTPQPSSLSMSTTRDVVINVDDDTDDHKLLMAIYEKLKSVEDECKVCTTYACSVFIYCFVRKYFKILIGTTNSSKRLREDSWGRSQQCSDK